MTAARRAARVDANQRAIVTELRARGYSVAVTSSLGNGFPDLVVGFTDRAGHTANLLVELKDGDKPPSKQVLTSDEMRFMLGWRGHVIVARNADEVVEEIKSR